MLRSTPAELSGIFDRIGQHVRDIAIRTSDASSRIEIDATLATALKAMPNLRMLTIIYDPLDTREHSPLLEVLRDLKHLEHITLAEPPRLNWAPGWPIRLGPTTETPESGSERVFDTDAAEEQIGITGIGLIGTGSVFRATKNLHSFRKLCLKALLRHHAPRLVSVRLHGSVPLDERNYRRLRDKARNLHVLQLVGAFESCGPGLVAAFEEDTRWKCSGRLRHLSISGSSQSAISEADVMRQFRLGVFGDGLDEPPFVSFGESSSRHPPCIGAIRY
jgi:hypothetical protein